MTDTSASCILRDTKTYEILYDLIQKEGDPVLNIPISFPEGSDWSTLLSMARDVKVTSVDIRVKPWQNMVVATNESTPGYVSGDFNTYLVVYPGCTYNDNEGMNLSSATISGRVASGTRTTAITGSLPTVMWNTYVPSEGAAPRKDEIQGFIDTEALESTANFHQVGKVVVGIKPEEFPIANTTTTAGAVRRQIADKIKRYGKVEHVEGKKKGRSNVGPDTTQEEYPDEPIEIDGKKHLYVKWTFQLEITAGVQYHVKKPSK